jgi:hypothetical protein
MRHCAVCLCINMSNMLKRIKFHLRSKRNGVENYDFVSQGLKRLSLAFIFSV